MADVTSFFNQSSPTQPHLLTESEPSTPPLPPSIKLTDRDVKELEKKFGDTSAPAAPPTTAATATSAAIPQKPSSGKKTLLFGAAKVVKQAAVGLLTPKGNAVTGTQTDQTGTAVTLRK